MSGVGCRVSGVGCRVSGVGCRVSGVGCRWAIWGVLCCALSATLSGLVRVWGGSGGGARLATGYFLPALWAESQKGSREGSRVTGVGHLNVTIRLGLMGLDYGRWPNSVGDLIPMGEEASAGGREGCCASEVVCFFLTRDWKSCCAASATVFSQFVCCGWITSRGRVGFCRGGLLEP